MLAEQLNKALLIFTAGVERHRVARRAVSSVAPDKLGNVPLRAATTLITAVPSLQTYCTTLIYIIKRAANKTARHEFALFN